MSHDSKLHIEQNQPSEDDINRALAIAAEEDRCSGCCKRDSQALDEIARLCLEYDEDLEAGESDEGVTLIEIIDVVRKTGRQTGQKVEA